MIGKTKKNLLLLTKLTGAFLYSLLLYFFLNFGLKEITVKRRQMRGKKRAEEWMHFTKASSLILSSFWFAA